MAIPSHPRPDSGVKKELAEAPGGCGTPCRSEWKTSVALVDDDAPQAKVVCPLPHRHASPASSLSDGCRPSTLSKTPSVSEASSTTSLDKESPDELPSSTSTQWARGVGFWRCFASICVPLLLSSFEGSVVSTALPTISRDLDLGPNSPWVATAFLLSSTVAQPLYGQLADIWGRRYPMMAAVLIFGVGSTVSALAKNGGQLIAGRVIQGLGTGGIDLFAELIICDITPLKRRGFYVAIKASVYAMGTTIGPVLGGLFAETDWRWCFGVNIPVCIVSLVMMAMWLKVQSGSSAAANVTVWSQLGQVDWVGVGLLTASVIMMLYSMSSGATEFAWSQPLIIGTLSAGMAGIVLFALWQRCRWCKHPIMPPRIFANRTTAAAYAVTVAHGFLTYGVQFYLPPFFQAVVGATPTESGVLILPCSLTIVLLAAVGGAALAKFGRYRLMHQSGFLLMVMGFLLCTIFSESRAVGPWVGFSLLVGLGSGTIVSTTLPTVLAELTDKDNAPATGSWAFLRGLGSLFGVAVPCAVFNARFDHMLGSIASAAAQHELDNGQAYENASASFVAQFGKAVKEQIIQAFIKSLDSVWILFLVVSALGLACSFYERQIGLRGGLNSDFGLEKRQEGDLEQV